MRQWIAVGLVLMVFSACSGVPAAQPTTVEPTLEPIPTAGETVIPSPEVASTETPQVMTLTVWIPDRIAPVDDAAVSDALQAMINEYNNSQSGVVVTIRRKRAQDVGGIMSTLRTASGVAPGALPDLTLIRREDLITAVQNRLVQLIDDLVTPRVISDLYPTAMRLGIVGDELYGLPFLIDAQIVAYQGATDRMLDWDFASVVERGMAPTFPASRPNGISDTFLVQYLEASDQLDRNITNIDVVPSALEEVLSFYQTLYQDNAIDQSMLNYTAQTEYQLMLVDGSLDAGVINSSTYLRLITQNPELRAGFIPTTSGQPSTIMNGWLWVVVTQNDDRQQAAGRFMDWMMQPNRQAAIAQVANILPSQRTALSNISLNLFTRQVLDEMLSRSILPAPSNVGGTPALLQTALVSVLTGEKTPESAVRDVMEAVQSAASQ